MYSMYECTLYLHKFKVFIKCHVKIIISGKKFSRIHIKYA